MQNFTPDQILELKKKMDEQALQQRLEQAEATAKTLRQELGDENFAKLATILSLASGAGHRNNVRAIQAELEEMMAQG